MDNRTWGGSPSSSPNSRMKRSLCCTESVRVSACASAASRSTMPSAALRNGNRMSTCARTSSLYVRLCAAKLNVMCP